jgi:hypothetical protein
MSRSTKSKADDTANGEKIKPAPAATDDSPITETEKSAGPQTAQKPAPSSGRKKIQSAAMGLMSLMSPKDKSSVDVDGEEEGGQKKPQAADAADNDDAPPELPPVHPMALGNPYHPMQQANCAPMETGYGGYGDGPGGSNNRILYPPPNMMDMPPFNPLKIPGPSNPSVHGGKSFPEILFEVVSNPNYQDIISWLSHGQGFQIHNKQLFAKRILPDYFDGAKFTSFTRRLKRWSFVRVSRGPELGAYYNKNFVRNQPELVQLMRYRLKEEGDGAARQGFPKNRNGGKKRELPDERDVTSTMGSMRQVHGGILSQVPNQVWTGAAVYGNDGFPQLPKPSQLPKRDTPRKNDGKDKDRGADRVDAKGNDKLSSPSEAKKSKHEGIIYNHSNFPSNSYGADMQLQRGLMNADMQSGMMMKNTMGSAFSGSGMANYPNNGMSHTYNNEDQPNEMPTQMMMSTSQGKMGMEGNGNYSMAYKMGSNTGKGSYEQMGSLNTGGGNLIPQSWSGMGPGGMQYCMPTDMPQGKMNSSRTDTRVMDEARSVQI